MAEYFRTYTPPVASPVTLDCELIAHRRPRYPNDPGAYTGEPDPQDIRGWLDAQTDEYRAEVLAPSRDGVDDIAADECGQCDQIHELLWGKPNRVRGDKLVEAVRKLHAQLSAAVAERDAAVRNLAEVEKTPRSPAALEFHRRMMVALGTYATTQAHWADDVGDMCRDLTSARETIRTLEGKVSIQANELISAEQALDSARADCRDQERLCAERYREIVADRDGWIACYKNEGAQLRDANETAFERFVARLMLDPEFRAAFEKERRALRKRVKTVRKTRNARGK